MAGILDVTVVGMLILAALIYALGFLAPRPLRRRVLLALAALARHAPGGSALGARLERRAAAAQSGCGGCGGCAAASPASKPDRIRASSSGLRRPR